MSGVFTVLFSNVKSSVVIFASKNHHFSVRNECLQPSTSFFFFLFYFEKFPNLPWIPCINLCFLEVNWCEIRLLETMNHPHFMKWLSGFNSKLTVTMVEYTFNHTVFCSLTRAASLPVACLWDLAPLECVLARTGSLSSLGYSRWLRTVQ